MLNCRSIQFKQTFYEKKKGTYFFLCSARKTFNPIRLQVSIRDGKIKGEFHIIFLSGVKWCIAFFFCQIVVNFLRTFLLNLIIACIHPVIDSPFSHSQILCFITDIFSFLSKAEFDGLFINFATNFEKVIRIDVKQRCVLAIGVEDEGTFFLLSCNDLKWGLFFFYVQLEYQWKASRTTLPKHFVRLK